MNNILNLFSKLLIIGIVLATSCYDLIAQNTATIYIMRKQTLGTPVKPDISVNDIELGKLSNKKYIECIVPAGNTSVSVYFSMSGNSQYLSFNAEVGKKYYIKASVNVMNTVGVSFSNNGMNNMAANSGAVNCSLKLSRMMDKEGIKLLKKCRPELVTDITDFISTDNSYYAQQEDASKPQNIIISPQAEKSPLKTVITSDVDENIPTSKTENKNTFVLIVANENYSFVDDVDFALNDGRTFKEYCVKTLGIPERQIWLYENASLGIISSGINKMVQAMDIFQDARGIIYYCGHGIPDDKTGDAYIIPVDGKGTDLSSCYSLNKLYNTMAEAKTSNITYFMDACFTGAKRDGSMIVAARGVAREPKKEVIKGNSIVFSAASGDETAMSFKEKGHGLFTYFLLKKLQETKGNTTYGELAEYIAENVKREAFLSNEKLQHPVVATSAEFADKWKNIMIK